jgi:PAS domain S-box-containing protein
MTDIEDDIAIRDALKAQEVQLRLIADNIPGPIAYLDRASTYTFVNQAFANWVRRPQDQIYGRTPFEVLRPTSRRSCAPCSSARRAARTSSTSASTRRPTTAALGARSRRARSRCVGQLRGLYCTEYDIHDLKMTEQALAAREEQLRLFTDNIPDPVVYLDTERRYTFVNEAFLNLNA